MRANEFVVEASDFAHIGLGLRRDLVERLTEVFIDLYPSVIVQTGLYKSFDRDEFDDEEDDKDYIDDSSHITYRDIMKMIKPELETLIERLMKKYFPRNAIGEVMFTSSIGTALGAWGQHDDLPFGMLYLNNSLLENVISSAYDAYEEYLNQYETTEVDRDQLLAQFEEFGLAHEIALMAETIFHESIHVLQHQQSGGRNQRYSYAFPNSREYLKKLRNNDFASQEERTRGYLSEPAEIAAFAVQYVNNQLSQMKISLDQSSVQGYNQAMQRVANLKRRIPELSQEFLVRLVDNDAVRDKVKQRFYKKAYEEIDNFYRRLQQARDQLAGATQ